MLIQYSFWLTHFAAALAQPSTCLLPQPLSPKYKHICSSPPEPYFVTTSHHKGLGVFASHDLDVGSIIMREPPILKITPPDHVKGSGYPMAQISYLVRREYEVLPPEQQSKVLGLTYHAFPGEMNANSDFLGFIFRTNAYNTGKKIGLFPRIARINHSCRPNVGYYWSEKLQKRVVYATRKISQGEEIFVSYIPLLLSRDERRKKLERYGFNCTCSACAQSKKSLEVSDSRRSNIGAAFKAFEPQLTLDVPSQKAILRKAQKNANSSLKLAKLVEEEGLADYYAKAYKIVAISHARVQDWETATVWANKGYEIRVMEDPESSHTMEMYSLTSRFIESWQDQLKNPIEKKDDCDARKHKKTGTPGASESHIPPQPRRDTSLRP